MAVLEYTLICLIGFILLLIVVIVGVIVFGNAYYSNFPIDVTPLGLGVMA